MIRPFFNQKVNFKKFYLTVAGVLSYMRKGKKILIFLIFFVIFASGAGLIKYSASLVANKKIIEKNYLTTKLHPNFEIIQKGDTKEESIENCLDKADEKFDSYSMVSIKTKYIEDEFETYWVCVIRIEVRNFKLEPKYPNYF